jgi:hypothetical protein
LSGFARWIAEGAGDATAIVEHVAFAHRTLEQRGCAPFGSVCDPHDLLVAWRARVAQCEQGPDDPPDEDADEFDVEPVDGLWMRRALSAALAAEPPSAFVAEVAALDARYQAVRPPLPRF